jgi:TonB-linked SusC/RagA family outer membrane protein
MKKLILYLSAVCCLSVMGLRATAQAPVQGKVVDETGAAVPGATIMVKNTTRGTVTSPQGTFRLDASPTDVLVVSAIGHERKEIPVSGQQELRVVLNNTARSLNQVVVIGYGSARKKDLTGAVTTIDAKDIAARNTVQVSDALQGAIAGVTVTRNSSSPGASSTIRFRGITTIGNNDPLVIVDGVPVGSIDDVDPNNIESVTALKDAASTSIYGSRAAAGVILITTKRGKTGQATLEYNYEFGNQIPTQLPHYVNAVRYMQLYNEYLQNDGSAPQYSDDVIINYMQNNAKDPDAYPNTDWQGDILKKSAPRQMHNLALTIGSQKVKTRASVGYSSTDGLYANRSFKRYNVQVNNDFEFNKILSASVDVSALHSDNNQTTGENPIYAARLMPATYDDLYSDGRFAPGKDGRNPLAMVEQGGYNKVFDNQLTGRIVINVKPFEDLTITALAAPTYDFVRQSVWSKQIEFTALDDPSKVIAYNQANTTLTESRPYNYSFNGQLLAHYTKTIHEDHHLSLLGGYETNYSDSEYLSASRGSFVLTQYPYLDDGSLALRDNSGGASEIALRSFFGRLEYNYRNKYYIQSNVRYDGSSRFNPKTRWGVFPSVSAGWTISEENFFSGVKPVTFLKIRGSWGQEGNDRIGHYPYQAAITFNNALFYNNGIVTPETSGAQVTYALTDISWETQQTSDVGLDAALFNGKLSVSADYYYKQTKGVLLALDIPVYLGFAKPYQNAGEVSSRGWELTTSWSDQVGRLKYNIGFNISDAKTRIDDLKGTEQLGDQANIQGGEFASWYGYRSDGLYQTADDVKNSAVLNANTKAGDVKYVDIDADGKITPDKDKVLLGGSLPRFIFGFTSGFEYGDFDLSLVLQGVGKQLSRLSNVEVQPFLENFGNIPTGIDGKFWSNSNSAAQNLKARYPRLSRTSDANNYQMSDFWLINGAYLRVKNLTLGYSIQSDFLKRVHMEGVRVYVGANDLFTFSRFPKGWDPEVGASTYPIVTTVMAGIDVKF